ncbi:NUDIX hydrolase [Rickettsiales endosymbiont of Stachyamoeba lipophora]|uniref:NUDIX hydrolase n=1 Tax=Rickettsiales endosymbiont of Stachyamoeba lipophora TaxID=2486578 RepID=UPI000F64F53A|nr:NUDIX hydrolase [Rickettsiales endosymbiont of Stachyamoeba lipophora]AZL16385.1 NUDIX domain-containing protein [Rickettsiales endosymbiont of Stachyamoeba lipophora]
MQKIKENNLLEYIRELQSIIQSGIAYSKDHYTQERFERLNQITAQMLIENYPLDEKIIKSFFGNNSGYATPKVAVRGAVFKDNKILLVKESTDGLWALPGGWADINLTPAENIKKEILEETGYIAKATKLIGLFDNRLHEHKSKFQHVYIAFFLCEIIGGVPQLSYETTDIGFFTEDDLPELSTGRVTLEEVKICFEHYNESNLLPSFD